MTDLECPLHVRGVDMSVNCHTRLRALYRIERTDILCRTADVGVRKLVSPPSFNKERKASFLCVVAMLKDTVWMTRGRGIETGNRWSWVG